jgi:hypothetical protein
VNVSTPSSKDSWAKICNPKSGKKPINTGRNKQCTAQAEDISAPIISSRVLSGSGVKACEAETRGAPAKDPPANAVGNATDPTLEGRIASVRILQEECASLIYNGVILSQLGCILKGKNGTIEAAGTEVFQALRIFCKRLK